MTPGYLNALTRHSWPGNVRELQNVIERSLVLANGGHQLSIEDLPPELQVLSASDELPAGSFHEALRAFKRDLVKSALSKQGGNKLQAAKDLGISRCYLHRLLNQLNVVEGAQEEPELQEDLMDDPVGAEMELEDGRSEDDGDETQVTGDRASDLSHRVSGQEIPIRSLRPNARIA
jgi:hypothetical protein